MADSGIRYMRPARPEEDVFEDFHQNGIFMCCHHLTLSAVQPLQEQLVRETFTHLYRKVPNLRACYGVREGKRWMCEMASENIDFEVVPDDGVEEVFHKFHLLKRHPFDSTRGPLWRARLLPDTEPTAMPELNESFPHNYHLLFAIHHGITDGLSSVKICGFIISLLNDMMAGRSIDDEEELGQFDAGEETFRLVKERKHQMEVDPTLREKLVQDFQSTMRKVAVMNGVFPVPLDSEDKSLNLTRSLSHSDTSRFSSRCRSEGVTVLSAFTALVNIALIDLLKDRGVMQDTYEIGGAHSMNLRRYWKDNRDTTRALGCHLSWIKLITDTPKDAGDAFWDYTRTLHRDLQKHQLEATPVQEIMLIHIFHSEPPNVEAMLAFLPPPHFYTISNWGDITSLLPPPGDLVQLTWLNMSSSLYRFNTGYNHMMQTFRGRFLYGLDYSTKCVSTEEATLYADTIFKHLHQVIQ
ncbi:uncharacterized protein LOC121853470 [Homarus americanus]|uniref:Condensation domain-containing protein n=1 Tax=Homarus americanus TaxID=6706 RepID=A0A8J5JH08_HOMAM|nr:uncharacterized protein LOC121853470 [Homarus americanus]KAG7156539.1 hypothetical protein Hamer_G006511 [Homarus americanus]